MATVEQITTAEQLFHAPALGRCELLRGELIMMSPAGSEHAMIVATVGAILRDFVKSRRLGVILGGDPGFHIARDPDTVRAPDVAFIRTSRVGKGLPKAFFSGPPDLAVEVLSPDDRAGEVSAKVQEWLDAGCVAVWIVDPRTQTVTVYDSNRRAVVLKPTDTLTGGDLLPGFSTPVAELFTL